MVFLLDMLVTSRTSYINDKGIEVNTPKEIAFQYIKGYFWLDFVATIPIDQILSFILQSQNPYLELFGILKLGRVLKLNKII